MAGKYLVIAFLLICIKGIAQNSIRITYSPPAPNTTLLIDGGSIQGLIPGDTIAISNGNYFQIQFKNINGTASKPVVIINKGGQAIVSGNSNYGIKIGGCSFVKLTGKGSINNNYGFLIKNILTSASAGGIGLSIDDLSTNVEVENVEIKNITFVGIMAKTDPTCSNQTQYPSFSMRNLLIHDSFLHNIGHEGMYIGSSKFKDGYSVTCNNVTTTVYPHLLKNLKIFRNIVDSTGWDGIQIGCADSCSVNNNLVTRDSQADSLFQMSGILIGGGSQNCDVYNNRILNGHGDALEILGQGNLKLFNNLIVNPGQGIKDLTQNKHGVFVNTSASTHPGWVYVLNNTVINPKNYGIYFFNNILPSKAINNIIIVPDPYHNAIVYLSDPNLENTYNLTKNTVTESLNLFTDPNNGDYSLTFFSEAKDRGTDLSSLGVTFDILNNPRPYPSSGSFDKGAYEYNPGVGVAKQDSIVADLNIFPNPNNGNFGIQFTLLKPTKLGIKIYNVLGDCVYSSDKQTYNLLHNNVNIDSCQLPNGLYVVQLQGDYFQKSSKMVVNK